MAQASVAIKELPHHKMKVKKPGQRSCNVKDDKGKICGGHLKRWYYMADVLEQACGDVEKAFGPNAEIYRCEHCKTLYLPNPEDPHDLNVAGQGQISTFGLTIPPKEAAKPAETAKPAKPAEKPAPERPPAAPAAEKPGAAPSAAKEAPPAK